MKRKFSKGGKILMGVLLSASAVAAIAACVFVALVHSGKVAVGTSDPFAFSLKLLSALFAAIFAVECVAICIICFDKKRKKHVRTYVSVLPALLLGVVIIPTPAIAVCATLGALIVVAAAALIAIALTKKKAKNKAAEEAISERPEETPAQSAAQPVAEEAPAQPVAEPVEEKAEAVAPQEEEQTPVAEEIAANEDAQPAPEEQEETQVEDLTNFEETGDTGGRAYDARRHVFVLVRYDRSFTARLIQADDKTKSYYDEIKGELMSYSGLKSRISWRHENFRIGRERVAKLQFRGKKLCLYLPLDPNDYIDSKYKIEDFSDVAKNKEVPLAYLIKNDLRSRYAKELIAIVMERFGAEKTEGEGETYSQNYPYDTLDNLIERKLIKVLMSEQEFEDAAADMENASGAGDDAPAEPIKPTEIVREVKAESVKKMISDERASHLIEESVRFADRTRTGFVNVDVLSRNFAAGEFVTLEEMKKRIKGFDKRMTYVKVLARGILDKPLIVEGDDFSIDAAKMILLTGGKVIRTKRQ